MSTSLLPTTATYMAFGTLACSGAGHLLGPRRFLRALRTQRLWPPGTDHLVVAGVIAAELAVGAIGLAGAVGAAPHLLRLAGFGAVTLYLLFAAAAAYLAGHAPGARCGCGGADAPASVWTVGRAGVLAFCAAPAMVGTGLSADLTAASHQSVVTALAALGLGMTIWLLPAALALPRGAETVRDARVEST